VRAAVAYLLAVTLLLAPATAWADPTIDVVLQHSPVGQRLQCNGETFQCYTFDEWKVLLLMDAELETSRQQLKELQIAVDLRVQEAAKLQEATATLTSINQELTLELTRTRGQNDKLLEENLKLKLPNPIPWIIFVAGLGFASLGLGLTIGSQAR